MHKWGKEDIFCLIKVRGNKGIQDLGDEMEVFISEGSEVHREGFRRVVEFLLYTKGDVDKAKNNKCNREGIQGSKEKDETYELL